MAYFVPQAPSTVASTCSRVDNDSSPLAAGSHVQTPPSSTGRHRTPNQQVSSLALSPCPPSQGILHRIRENAAAQPTTNCEGTAFIHPSLDHRNSIFHPNRLPQLHLPGTAPGFTNRAEHVVQDVSNPAPSSTTASPLMLADPVTTAEVSSGTQGYRPMNGITTQHGPPSRYPISPYTHLLGLLAPPSALPLTIPQHDLRAATGMGSPIHNGPVTRPNRPIANGLNQGIINIINGFSPNYAGDTSLPRNRGANIPDELNCSLFLVNLPADLTTTRLMAAIHDMGPTGRIYATHINTPEPDRRHPGCAAKLVFFERDAAHHFYKLCCDHGLTIDGQAARVMWNRIKTAQQDLSRDTTRVLVIAGDNELVNPRALTDYFRSKLTFQIDRIIVHNDGRNGCEAVVEYRFGSFRCQAEAARMALVREHPNVKCFFFMDPCAPQV